MSVSDGLSNKHVGPRWGMSVLDGYQMKHVEDSDNNNIFMNSLFNKS